MKEFDAFDFVENYAAEHAESLVKEIKEAFQMRIDQEIIEGAQKKEPFDKQDYLTILIHTTAMSTLRYSLQGSAAMLQAYRLHREEEI